MRTGAVLLAGVVLVTRRCGTGQAVARQPWGLTALVVGTTCYLVNLLARAAVVLSWTDGH